MHRLQTARQARLAALPDQHTCRARLTAIETRFTALSEREREVLQLVMAGAANKRIAHQLGIAEVTVKFHRAAMMRKMEATSLIDLVRMWDALVRGAA